MNNTKILEEEYNEYIRLNNEKNTLESSLRELSGHNDEENVRRMNEISKRLGEINNIISLYNQNILDNVQKYLNIRNKYNELSRDIKAIEELSKESKRSSINTEFITLSSSEGRSKQIDKKLASDYIKLVEEKNRIKNELNKNYDMIKNNMSMKSDLVVKEEMNNENNFDYYLPNIETYDDLPIEEKIKQTKDILERIFSLINLPNMGKKVVVTYNNKKYEIPEKYQGVFKSTYLELRKLEQSLENKAESSIKEETTIPVKDKENIIQEEKTSTSKEEEMYNKLGIPFDQERQKRINELVNELFGKKENEDEIKIRKDSKHKITTAKSFILTASKKTTSYLKDKYKHIKDKKDEISYTIVNRTTKFKDNTCQRVNESKSKITTVKKEFMNRLRLPFDRLREIKSDYLTRRDIIETVDRLKKENELLKAKNKTLVRKYETSGGYVSTAVFIILTSVIITIVIFLVVGFIVFR